MTQSGIAADVNGIFKITALPSTLPGLLPGFSVRVTLQVDSITAVEMFAIQSSLPEYLPKAQFSINALNQLRASIWVETDKGEVATSGLGTASYTVYDASGVAVAGLTESGIAADGNGIYASTPASATLLTDLTHYTVKVQVTINGILRTAYKGFSLLGN